jgi:hypothetical protein
MGLRGAYPHLRAASWRIYGLKVSVTTLLGCEAFNPKTLAIDRRAKFASN